MTLTLMELGTEAIGGAFDGYLRRWDYERGENQNVVKQYSTWFEVIAAVGGLWMERYSRSPRTQDFGDGLAAVGLVTLGGKAGVWTREKVGGTAFTTAPGTAVGQRMAAGQVFPAMRAAPAYVPSAGSGTPATRALVV